MATRRARSSGPAAESPDDDSGEPSASALADEDDDSSEPGQEASDSGEASEPIPVAGEAFLCLLCCASFPCKVKVNSDWLGGPGLQAPPAVTPGLRCTHQPLAPSVLKACMGTADGSSDEDPEGEDGEIAAGTEEDAEADATEEPEEAPEAEAAPAVKEDAEAMPADISLNRPSAKTPVIVPTDVLGMSHSTRLQADSQCSCRQESQIHSRQGRHTDGSVRR